MSECCNQSHDHHSNQVSLEFARRQLSRGSCIQQRLNKKWVTVLWPLVIEGVHNSFLAFVLWVLEPVRGKNSASVCWITAKAALGPLWKDNPSFILGSNRLAGSGYIWENTAAESIVSTIDSIHSLFVVFRVIELLPINSVDCLINCVGLVKSDMVCVVVEGRRDGDGCAE